MAVDMLDRPLGLAKIFGSIAKVEDQDDGSIKVYGIASSESRDASGEIVAADAMRAALPDYSKFPALREMHQPMAAGKVLEAEVDDEGITHIVAHVVDPIAIVKVRTGVYAGFSIGGKVKARDPKDRSIITDLRLIEISLVDSPCNPDAVLSMWKADTMTDFKPASADVIERAKKLAKAAGTARFKDFLFEASQELISEHLIEKGELEAPADEIEASALADEPAAEAPAGEIEPEAPAAEAQAEGADNSADTGADNSGAETASAEEEIAEAGEDSGADNQAEASAAGEGAGDDGEAAPGDDEIEAAAMPDPAAALNDALKAAGEALEAAAPAAEEERPAAAPDFGKFAAALKSIALPEGKLEKSMWSISRFADLLSSLACVQSDLAWEKESEGDDSPIPEQLRQSIANLGDLLVAAAKEEVAELVAALKGEPEVIEIIYEGDGIEAAQEIVDLIKADEALIGAAEDRLAKSAPPAPAAEEAPEPNEDLEKLRAENERLSQALAEAAPAVEDLSKRFKETIEPLQAEVAELRKRFEEEPLPAKTAGTGRVVAKSQDSAGGAGEPPAAEAGEGALSSEDIEKMWGMLTAEQKGEIQIRASLRNPGMIRLPLQPAA